MVTVVGLGNMGLALVEGLMNAGVFSREEINGIELSDERAQFVEKRLGINIVKDYEVVKRSQVVILAVKPQNMREVLKGIAPYVVEQIVISIAAGISTALIRSELGDKKIVRTMPNTPALISKGITGVFCTEKVLEKEKEVVKNILSALGEVVFVEKEDEIDKITALSGSGPAYVYYFMEALEDAGVFIGLPRPMARKLVLETMLGSLLLLKNRETSPTVLKEMVTSPGGTTINALYQLEKDGVKGAIYSAVMAAYKRAKELES